MRSLAALGDERPSVAAVVLAVATPFLFLHPNYQLSATAHGVTVDLTDLALLAVTVAACASGVRRGWAPLRPGRAVWLAGGAFLVWIVLSFAWARRLDPGYGLGSHLSSFVKFAEYAVLAPALPLVLRRRSDLRLFVWVVVLWSAFLSLIGVLQFLGLVHEFKGRRPEQREPSYIGVHDLGAYSGAALSLWLAALLVRLRRRETTLAGVAGAFGVAVAAAMDAVGGMWLTAAVAWILARRRTSVSLARTLALVGVCAVVTVAAVFLRGSAISQFLRFVGIEPATQQTSGQIQTYAQRTVLAYIGVKIFLAHPILGVGWQESALPASYGPQLPAAHRRFPNAAAQSFPSAQHHWGIQNGLIQVLADLGAIGALLFALLLLAALRLAVQVALRGPPERALLGIAACGWTIFGVAVFTGSGMLPALAVDALLWLSFGLPVALLGMPEGDAVPSPR